MKITNPRKRLCLYFRPVDLLTVDGFIKYCKNNGLRVTQKELEYFDRNNLLLPAIWINPGYSSFIKATDKKTGKEVFIHPEDSSNPQFSSIGKKTYYSSSGFDLGEIDNWLDEYIKLGLTLRPNEILYKKWSIFSEQNTGFTTDRDSLENCFVPFYSEVQFYQLRFLLQKLSTHPEGTLADTDNATSIDPEWNVNSNQCSAFNAFIISRCQEYLRLISLLGKTREIISFLNEEEYKAYNRQLKEGGGDRKEALREAKERVKYLIDVKRLEAQSILKSCNLSVEKLTNMRTMILEAGTFPLEPSLKKRRAAYVKSIDESTLIESEPAYNDTKYINRFLEICGEKPKSVKDLLIDLNMRICEICGTQFESNRKKQFTCGNKICQNERKKYYKAKKRKDNPNYGK